jgi:hypothetical protein
MVLFWPYLLMASGPIRLVADPVPFLARAAHELLSTYCMFMCCYTVCLHIIVITRVVERIE